MPSEKSGPATPLSDADARLHGAWVVFRATLNVAHKAPPAIGKAAFEIAQEVLAHAYFNRFGTEGKKRAQAYTAAVQKRRKNPRDRAAEAAAQNAGASLRKLTSPER